MKRLQLTIATALLLGLSSAAFAETPKTDAKANTKVPAKVESASPATTKINHDDSPTFTYYVTGEETVQGVPKYDVTTTDPNCDVAGANPCEIKSIEQMDSQGQIDQSAVTDIVSTRP